MMWGKDQVKENLAGTVAQILGYTSVALVNPGNRCR